MKDLTLFELRSDEVDYLDNLFTQHKDGQVWGGSDGIKEKINKFWHEMGTKYHFDSNTVEGVDKGKQYFLAKPIRDEL